MPLTRSLYNMALRLTRRPQDAADLVQETFLRAYRTFPNFTPGTNAKAWLFTILYSIFVNAYRRKEREPEMASIEDLEERFQRSIPVQDLNAHLQILGNLNIDWKGSEIQRELERLPESFRAAVLLVDVEDLSYEEAAAALGCPVGTLRSRLFRGRRILAVGLQEYACKLGYVRR